MPGFLSLDGRIWLNAGGFADFAKARRKAWEKVARMPWQRAIIVDVTTMDEDMEEVNV